MNISARKRARTGRHRGFTLLELLVALGVFLVVVGAALSFFSQNQPLFNRQQNLSALNITMRNAIAQLQLDVVNAGTGYYPGTNFPDWPVGVTIQNSTPTTPCNTPSTYTYSSTCFDTLNIITTDQNTPPTHPDNGSFTYTSADCIATTTSPIYLAPATGLSASNFLNGDELLLVDTTNSKMTTIKLTSAGSSYTNNGVTGVKLTFNVTNSDGTNSSTNDPLGITTCTAAGTIPCPAGDGNPKLNTGFCSTDWVLRLAPITYSVTTANASDPQLQRTQSGTTSILADQVIGFKVGAAAWNSTDDTTPYSYCATNAYNATPPPCSGYSSEWWLIRSVQISLIARTTPVTDPTYTYRNGFDGGPYQIQSVMATINPRNLSMNND